MPFVTSRNAQRGCKHALPGSWQEVCQRRPRYARKAGEKKGKRQKAKGKGQKEGALREFLDSSRSDTFLLPFALCLLPFAFLFARLLPTTDLLPQRYPHRER